MKIKKLTCFVAVLVLVCFSNSTHADIFPANGNTGFGGNLGNGSLEITNISADTISFCLDLDSALSNDVIIYIDSQSGGFSDTSTFADNSDPIRAGISNFNGNEAERTTINFGAGFEPDFAIGADSGFQGLWELQGGPFHNFIAGNSASGTQLKFDVSFADLGISQGDSIQFAVTHTSTTGFLSDELIAGGGSTGFDGGNPGFGSSVTVDPLTFTTTAVIPEPSSAMLLLLASLAFGMRRRR